MEFLNTLLSDIFVEGKSYLSLTETSQFQFTQKFFCKNQKKIFRRQKDANFMVS